MVILHIFSIETAYEPSLMHIINQTIIKLDIIEITDYSFFTMEHFCLDLENLNVLCLRAGDSSHLISPHSL
jgi:hypothetical protein